MTTDATIDDGPPDGLLHRVIWVVRRVGKEWSEDRVPDLAAGVAFYAIASVLPALLALAAMLGVLESVVGGSLASRAEEEVISFLGDILTSEADGTLDAASNLFSQSRPGLLTFSLLAALWTLSRGFASLVRSLDVVYDIDEDRSWLHIRLTALGLSIGSVVAVAVMLGLAIIGPLLGSGQELADDLGVGGAFVFVWDVLRYPVLFALLIAWAATIFHVAPNHHTPWRWDVPGAVLTSVLWATVSLGFRFYVELAGSGSNAVVGALGGILLVLVWLWLLAVAVLLGGELNEVLYQGFGDPGEGDEPEPRTALSGVEGGAQTGDEVAGIDGRATVDEDAHDG